jgi:Fic family protein
MHTMDLHDVVELMQMEYAEMPELKLTLRQAQRLWNVSTALCERALETLINMGFLARTSDGAYIRRSA